ncbi:adenylate/guanylate cyclase domain-containing protein [Roseospira goensis]|uniref:Adenylate cyclase n=1 Tax=Roseospira goensis TaxID=391922 RepID=A0A7W6WJN9_9PROT|nr:adenylate/guanylate cyclase domain-containing protein [Roseospira goensis]MBB4285225.1 adenylate cyclase [Roseospira goensis]
MPTIAHYEVYTLEDSGWVLHTRYVSTEKAKALDEAKALDVYLNRPAKVLRETYDTDTNRYAGQTVFLSQKAAALRRQGRERWPASHRRPGGAAAGGAPAGGLRPHARMPPGLDAFGEDLEDEDDGGGRGFLAPTHAKSTSDLLARVIFVIVAGLVIATSGTALIPVVINLLRGFGLEVSGAALSETLFAVFMVLFLASGFLLTLRLVPLHGVRDDRRRRKRPRPRPQGSARREEAASAAGSAQVAPEDAAAPGGGPAQAAEAAARAAEAEREAERIRQDKEKEKEREREREREKEKKAKEKERKKKKGEEADADAEGDPDAAGEAASESEDGPADVPEEVLSPGFVSGRAIVMTFLGGYVSALKAIRPRLDTYNRFGINLYLAGVCQVLAQEVGLTRAEFERLLRETVEIMGTRPAQAASFVERLGNYLGEDRYNQMVQSGREAMTLDRRGAGEPFANLGMVIEDWNTPKTQTVSGSTIAIVFTDMVGSTDLTSEHGDVKAQQILRAHNSAVRSALARFGGREIKHTGDGIMATFDHVPDAVWGMIDVLKAVRAHNQTQPEIPLRIRIGINAGEPISAENDYYGLAVTIAARICAKADMNQIYVSQVVRDLCEGTELRFADRGAEPLKGIKQAQHLHEALWDGAPSLKEDTGQEDTGDGATTPDAGAAAEEGGTAAPEGGTGEPDRAATGDPDGSGGSWDGPAPVDPEAEGWVEAAPARPPSGAAAPDGLPDLSAGWGRPAVRENRR